MLIKLNDLDRAKNALYAIEAGCPRDEWIKIGMSAKAAGLDFDDFHAWSATGQNFKGERDCRVNWDSFNAEGGITAASLFGIARSRGWTDPTPHNTRQNPTTSAADIWQRGVDAPISHPYIRAKQGYADGLRIYPETAPALTIKGRDVAGHLMVPCTSNGILQTIQFIGPDGEKLNLSGASFNDGYFSLGHPTDQIFVTEGIGQAWACNLATDEMAVCAFGAGRMRKVALELRSRFPSAHIVIVADKGKDQEAEAIAKSVNGRCVCMPPSAPANFDANDFALEYGIDVLAELLAAPTIAQGGHIELLTEEALLDLGSIKWRIQDILPQQGVAAIYGASGSGKSFLALDAIQSIAAGRDWFGYPTAQCPVLYCALEGESGWPNRVKAYRIKHEAEQQNIRYLLGNFNLTDRDDVDALLAAINSLDQKPEVIVLDTLNRAVPGIDENDAQAMGKIIAAAKHLHTQISGLVLLVHHSGKDSSKGLRGHSSLHAALDAAIEVRRQTTQRVWSAAKVKDGLDGSAHKFGLEIVALDQDATSCTVSPSGDAVSCPTIPPKSSNQQIVYDELRKLLSSMGPADMGDRPQAVPEATPFIRMSLAIEKIRTKLPCEPKRQTERTHVALKALIEKGLVVSQGDMLWIQ